MARETFLVRILENEDDLTENAIFEALDGFELEFDVGYNSTTGYNAEAKVQLIRLNGGR